MTGRPYPATVEGTYRIAICIIGRTYDCRSYFAALAPSGIYGRALSTGRPASIRRRVHFILQRARRAGDDDDDGGALRIS